MRILVRTRLAATASVLALLLGPAGRPVLARQDVRVDPAVTPRGGTVTGTVWHRDDSPVANANLQLRDLTRGQVVQATIGDQLGRFTFTSVTPGNYVVELVDDNGTMLALGQAFAIGPIETVATFIRVGAAIPWYDGFFSNAAAAALASAAALGVTAIGNGGQPASARS